MLDQELRNSAQCSLFLHLQKYLLFAFGRPLWWRNIHRRVAPAWLLPRDPGPPTSPAFLRLGHHLLVQGFYPRFRFQGSHALFVLSDLGRHPRHRRFDLLKTVRARGGEQGRKGGPRIESLLYHARVVTPDAGYLRYLFFPTRPFDFLFPLPTVPPGSAPARVAWPASIFWAPSPCPKQDPIPGPVSCPPSSPRSNPERWAAMGRRDRS